MFAKMHSGNTFHLLTALLVGLLLLSACAPATLATTLANPTATSLPVATIAQPPTAVPTSDGKLHFSLDKGSLVTGFPTETVAAVTDSNASPYWEVLPEYTRVTLQGYPISNHLIKPQIFIYPVMDLGKINEGAGKIADSLQDLLKSPQEITNMPFMPLYNASQMMHVQVKYLDFRNGKGVRYLTQFTQGFVPINNNELIYTYQGLTGDGKYYVAAVLPVNHPSLPADGKVTGKEPPEFTSAFPTYVANVAKALKPQAANSFAPDLTQLDALMSSLDIR